MEFFPIQTVAGYMCQPSPPQSTAVPPNMYPTLMPPAPPHEIALRKIPAPCAMIPPNAYPGSPITVHLPTNLILALRREPTKYNAEDMISTCSSCGQNNTLWELRIKEMCNELAEDYELKRFLLREIRFEPYPGEEPPPPTQPPHSVANNIGYPQPAEICKTSNLRPNANEFTPQKQFKTGGPQSSTTNNAYSEECDYPQSAGRLGVTESSTESGAQDSSVSGLGGNQDPSTVDSIPEKYPQNECVISSHGGSTESVNRTDSSSSSKRKLRKGGVPSTTRRDTRLNESEMKVDNNRNYKPSDDTNVTTKKDKTNDNTRYNYSGEHPRPNSRSSDAKRSGPINGKPNGLPPRSNSYASKSRAYDKRSGGEYNNDGFSGSKSSWSKSSSNSSNGSVPRKSNRRTSEMSFVHEIEGDLFTAASSDCSLAHCVAEDFRMGAGIAVQFRKQFGHVGELLNQRKTVGEVAYIEQEGRYIFYLVTKKHSHGKPSLESMSRALKTLRRHCDELSVKKLAMPQIGCGLDKLRWEDVKQQLYDEFCQTDVEIFVYHLKEEEALANAEVSPISNKSPKLRVVEVAYPLTKIECSTALVVYGAADGRVDKANEPLNGKFPFLEDFEKKCKSSPKEIFYPFLVQDEYVCILIVRNTLSEPFDFAKLENSIRKFNSFLKSNRYQYVGIERIEEPSDPLINEKIINVFRGNLITSVDLYVCSMPPRIYSNMSASAPKYSTFSSNVNSTASSN